MTDAGGIAGAAGTTTDGGVGNGDAADGALGG